MTNETEKLLGLYKSKLWTGGVLLVLGKDKNNTIYCMRLDNPWIWKDLILWENGFDRLTKVWENI